MIRHGNLSFPLPKPFSPLCTGCRNWYHQADCFLESYSSVDKLSTWNGCFQDVWLDRGVQVAFLEILSWERSDRSWVCLNCEEQFVWTDFRKQDLVSKRTQTYEKIRNSSTWEPPVLQPEVTSESPSELLAQFQGDVKGISLGTR